MTPLSKVAADVARALFWTRTDMRGIDECWPWLGSTIRMGRGTLNVGGKTLTAPRVAWLVVNGELPPSHIFVCQALPQFAYS